MKVQVTMFASMMLSMASANAASKYHLICRGGIGSTTHLSIVSYVSGGGTVYYSFKPYKGKKSDVKRDGSHLAAGQCSWATDVLSSKYSTLVYHIKDSMMDHSIEIDPVLNSDKSIDLNSYAVVSRSSKDSNQSFIPFVNGNDATQESVKGSIFDDKMIFDFYVSIDEFNQLVLQ